MRVIFIVLCILVNFKYSLAQQSLDSLEIIDLSHKQIHALEAYKNKPENIRNKYITASLFTPYKDLWEGYLGNEKDFTQWVNDIVYKELEMYKRRIDSIDIDQMNIYLNKTITELESFTGYKAKGKWYIFFGPKWTNAGGIGNNTMVIDLAFPSNNNLEEIKSIFSHEINHQIYKNINTHNDINVLSRIIDEGFATYVDYIFNKDQKTKQEALSYTYSEFRTCLENEKQLFNQLYKYFTLSDQDSINRFVARNLKFDEKLPGAIGYYLGFRIIEEYVKLNGPNSWKDIYSLSPQVVLNKSKIINSHIKED